MQVVGYDPSPEPALLISDGDGVDRQTLRPGTDIAFPLGERSCAGQVVTDGDTLRHVECPNDAAPRCEACTETWVCARCTGTCLKDEMDCHEDHAVYLAAFAPDTVKVGVTRQWRLERRLREQGADRGALIRTVENGRIARDIEAGIADEIPDRIRIGPKLAGLHQSVDEAAWRAALSDFDPIDRIDLDYGFDLDGQPIPARIATGTVLGVKGRVLVLERGGTTYAVDLRELVGCGLLSEASDRSRQSSLETF